MSSYCIVALILCGLQQIEAQLPPPPTGYYFVEPEDCVEVFFDDTVNITIICELDIVGSDPLRITQKNPNYFVLNDPQGYARFADELAEDCLQDLVNGDLTFYDYDSSKNRLTTRYQGASVTLSPGECPGLSAGRPAALVWWGLQQIEAQRPTPPSGDYFAELQDCVQVSFAASTETVRLEIHCNEQVITSKPLKISMVNPNHYVISDTRGYDKFVDEVDLDCFWGLERDDLKYYGYQAYNNVIEAHYQRRHIELRRGRC